MFLYENDKIPSNSISVLNYFDNLEELLNKLEVKFDKVKVGSQIGTRFILSRFPKKDNFTAIYEPPVFRNIIIFELKVIGFCIISIVLYLYFSRLEKYMAKKIQYRNNPFNVTTIFKCSNQIPRDLQRTIPFKFEKMMFVNPTLQRGVISIDKNNIEIFITIPISSWAAIACNLIIPNSDIRFYEPIFVGNGEFEADDSMNRCKIPIYAESPTKFRIKLPCHDLLCYAPSCCLPKMFVCTRCYDYVMMNFILDIYVISRNLEGITGLIKSLYWKLDYDGLGFFCSVSSKIETVEFISDDPKLKQIVLDILPKIEQHKNPENGVKIHLNGIEIMGFVYGIGRSKYYFVCILKNQPFQFVERGFSVICAYIAMIFHIYVTHSEDSLMIERIDKLISANTKATYLEFVGQTAYSTNTIVEYKGE